MRTRTSNPKKDNSPLDGGDGLIYCSEV